MSSRHRPATHVVVLAAIRLAIGVLGGRHPYLAPAMQALDLLLDVAAALPSPVVDSVQSWCRHHRDQSIEDEDDQ